jgi:GNAT superfamily N-acetyltransferase
MVTTPLRIGNPPRTDFKGSAGELTVEATTLPGSTLDRFYEGYDRSFVLSNEKEMLAGFVECLDLNRGQYYQKLSGLYGPFREVVLLANDPLTRMQVGGANFIAYPVAAGDAIALNLNYIYVLPEARGRGHLKRLLRSTTETAKVFFENTTGESEVLVFIEQNDPLRMTTEDYVHDSRHTGLDQVERIRIWAKLGARLVDVRYVQPPLSKDQEADENLVYSVLGARRSTLSACTLHDHLQRFFAISVLKGRELENEPSACSQLEALSAQCGSGREIALLDPFPALDWLAAHPASGRQDFSGGLLDLTHSLSSVS